MAETLWGTRFAFAGQIPLSYPELNPVALGRIRYAEGSGNYLDGVDDSRLWTYEATGTPAIWMSEDARVGRKFSVNLSDPAAEQGRLELQHFDGLWPSGGRLLIGLWAWQRYQMTFNPLMDTRATDPLVYLSTADAAGDPRLQIYSAEGSLLLDEYEFDLPWAHRWDEPYFLGALVDLDGGTAQVFSVLDATGDTWLGPERTFSGTPNLSCTANLDLFSLRHANFWESGSLAEPIIAHPGAEFDLQQFVADMGRSVYATAQDGREGQLDVFTVDDDGVHAVEAGSFDTGAELVEWDRQPILQGVPAGSQLKLSDDDGDTWQDVDHDDLPEQFAGLARWSLQLAPGDTFAGLDLAIPEVPAPTLGPLADVSMEQGELVEVALDWSASGPEWAIAAGSQVEVTRDGDALHVGAGFDTGDSVVTVTLSDEYDRSIEQSFTVTVEPRTWQGGPPPEYPHAPVIMWDDDGPSAVLIDAEVAVVTKEVNGAHTFDLALPASHRHAQLLKNERVLQVAGDRYWIRRLTTERSSGGAPVIECYAEARFYELATAGEVAAREWSQVTAGRVMEYALQGTDWSVDVANVTTRRTYDVEDMNPLELLREVQSQHGGDLIFDNEARTVSLVTQSGRDNGVAFFHGHGLTESRRVVDTTSLVTRLYARNEDGLTIESVNGGLPYVEDYSYSAEVRSATYKFKAGTNPNTMLSMAQATLANRSQPDYSYEATVSDLSARTGEDLDRFDIGDLVTVVDPEIGLQETQRIVELEYDVIRPWESQLTLSAKLRETSSGDSDSESVETGSTADAFDLVPFNLLRNARFDNGLAHWAHDGVTVVDGQGTGDYAVRFAGSGERWIEQTVVPDNRSAYAFSFDVDTSGPSGWQPDLTVEAVVTYEDGSTETIELELS